MTNATLPSTRRPPTSAQILERQKADAERARATIPAPVAPPDVRTDIDRYIDDVAPSMIAGRLIKFDGKRGVFFTSDDGEAIAEDAEFIALIPDVLIGWIRFRGEGEAPDRIAGLLFDGFRMPERATLGDNNPDDWPVSDGRPIDPWLHQQMLPLQNTQTHELYTYVTQSITGRRSIGNLLRSFNRTRASKPDELPVIRLKAGSFAHRDKGVGRVNVPVLTTVGHTKRETSAPPDTTARGDMDDEIPFDLR